MIRVIFAFLFVLWFLLVSYLIFPIECLIGRHNPEKKGYSTLRIVQWAIRVILVLSGVKITVKGKENILDEPTLYVANHRSMFDVLIMYAQCSKLTGFVAKDAIEKVPSMRVWMRYLFCIFLDRKDPRSGMKMLVQAIEQIQKGISMCIFPEGTRNKGEELSVLPFKEGTFKIALKSGCPVVPVSINNSIQILEAHFPKLRKTHVILEYGKPIYPAELTKEEQKVLGATCRSIIEKTLQRNHETK